MIIKVAEWRELVRAATVMQLVFGLCMFTAEILPPAMADAPQGETAITCTNPVSGASWQVKIDYSRATADSNPAHISDAEISWHDQSDGGNYTLDRRSGELTVIVASSTGGYFLHHRCKLKN